MFDFDISWLGDLVGLLGVALYLASYALLQAGRLTDRSYGYPVMNILAASCVLVDLSSSFNLPSALIQMSWILISLVGIWRITMRAQERSEEERQASVTHVIHRHDLRVDEDEKAATFKHAWDRHPRAGASPL